jgi:hypothetical protein
MKKISSVLILALALPSLALAGVWDMIGHLPSGIGTSNMAVSRYYDASAAKDGIALIGGSTSAGDTNLAFFFSLSDQNWTWLSNYPYSASAAAAAKAGDTLYVHGGWCSPNVKDSTFKYANAIYSWDVTNMNSLTPRAYHGLVNLYNRYLYAVGGTNNIGQVTASVERLDPQGGPPIYVQSMPQSRTSAVTVTAIGADAKPHIYVLGGKDSLNNILNSVIEYDSATGWTTMATAMPLPRWQATGAVVNGSIYLIGGVIDGSNTITRRVDIYNPVTNTWMLGDSIPLKLFRAGACGVNNVIYLFGGSDPAFSQSDSVWLYRPLAPNPPPQLLPLAGTQLNYQQVDFYWGSVPSVTQYRIQVSSDSTFTTIDVANSLTVDTNSTGLAIYLGSAGDYFWRVKAYDWALPDSSKWSPVRKLTLDMTPPDPPSLSTPMDGTFTNNMTINFSWFAVDSIMSYHLQVSKDAAFGTLVMDIYDLVTTSTSQNLSTYGESQYYWRVESKDSAGNFSGFGATPTFTIDQTAPSVSYFDPYNNETSVAVNRDIIIGFSEPINHSIAGNFGFTCSPDPLNWGLYWNGTGDTVTLTHDDFAEGQSVSFTVSTARDMAGNDLVSSYSSNFTTIYNDLTPPSIDSIPVNDGALYENSGITFTAYITDDKKMGTVNLYWGPAGYVGYTNNSPMSLGGSGYYECSIPAGDILPRGLQYQIAATDSAGNYSYFPPMGDYYIHSVNFAATTRLNTNIIYDKWQMVSIPTDARSFNIFMQFSEDELQAYDNTRWRLFEWKSGGYQEINDFSLGSISELGRAYWLRHRTSVTNILFQGPTQSYGDFNQTKSCSLNLYPGWNDVGTPFMFNIDWANVMIPAGVAGPYFYDGDKWLIPDSVTTQMDFAPFRGFSFRNDNGSTMSLEITPYQANKKESKEAGTKMADGWRALVTVENGAGLDQNYFGLSTDAMDQRDRYDYPEPPSGLTGTSGYFWMNNDQFCSDIRPELGDGQTWDFATECNGQTKITVALPAEFPAGAECYLADLTRQVSVTIKGTQTYNFTPEPGETIRNFKLIAGKPDYAKGVLGSSFALPTATLLMQNRPNPFRGSTEISYQLSSDSPVSLKIYNISGQLVKTLVNRPQMAGRYATTWNGRDEQGRCAANGVYFYRLTAGATTANRQLVIVK